jgi:hypothetical protein
VYKRQVMNKVLPLLSILGYRILINLLALFP